MKKINIKYLKGINQVWLLRAALFVSIFSFSGFNLQAHSILSQSFKTELVESRNRQEVYQLKRVYKKYSKALLINSHLIDKPFNIRALWNYHNVLNNKFKLCQNRTFPFHNILIKLFFKTATLSSEDDPSSSCLS